MSLQLNHSSGLRIEKDDQNVHLEPFTFKYDLKCNQCSWSITFYEATGSIQIEDHKMLCPFCRQKDIRWIRFPF